MDMAAFIICPRCGEVVPPAAVPDQVLLSERGRRNAARRKTFGARPKGQMMIWRQHNPNVRHCRCGSCLLAGVQSIETRLDNRIQAHVTAVGVEPIWAKEERGRVRNRRTAIEMAMRQHRLEDLEATDGRAA